MESKTLNNDKEHDSIRVPNHAIKHVRKAMGLNQSELGNLLGLTQSYVANIETGRFPTTMNFAVRLAGKSGADVSSIFKGIENPLDYDGRVYTEISYLLFKEARTEILNQDDYNKSISEIKLAIHAAADIGKRKVFINILNTTLIDTIQAVDGLGEAIEKRLEEEQRLAEEKSKTRAYTYGELRGNPALAQALGFLDNAQCDCNDVAVKLKIL